MQPRTLSIITGVSYWIIFFAAIFANFFVLEALRESPMATLQNNALLVRFGILAFLITVVFDVVVAWGLYKLYQENPWTGLSISFRMMHAAIMGVAIFALPFAIKSTTEAEILGQVDIFNTIWLIGLFFFGIHLILLGIIIRKPLVIALFLMIAGIMYILDTSAHFLISNYSDYQSIFLILVAIPSILGEMSFAIWLILKGGKSTAEI
ncbi:DUF4386 domain-containing protein [Salegentibacter sediminis]|uniref:DUF4386 domain-containing protein n=1 Tax=Salegentibacter sediminis TaxID=1930251 RepID=UPI0009BFD075|nr:DUF4386 domain-containing protein [Salegentibacter sediminis]